MWVKVLTMCLCVCVTQVRLWVNGHSFLDKHERKVVDQHTVTRSIKAYSGEYATPSIDGRTKAKGGRKEGRLTWWWAKDGAGLFLQTPRRRV